MNENIRLSFSAFETYAQCPLRFKRVYIDKVREPSNKYALFGSAFHILIDKLYETEQFVCTTALELWPEIFHAEAAKDSYKHIPLTDLVAQKTRGAKDIKTWFKMAERERILHPCIEHEVKIIGNFKESPLAAKIDLVLSIKGGLGIIDWKTGQSDYKNLMQLALYAVLYYKKTGRKIDWLVPFYVKTKDVVYQPCNDEIIKEASMYFGDLYRAIVKDGEYLPKPGPNCYFCSFRKDGSCPAFQRNLVEI